MIFLPAIFITTGLFETALTSQLNQSFPELDLLQSFFHQNRCFPDKIIGNQHSIIAEVSDGFETDAVHRESKQLRGHCRAVVMFSSKNLAMDKIEEMTFGSFKSIIIMSGPNYEDLDTEKSLRPIYYFQYGAKGTTMHIHCPRLHGKGNWLLNRGAWIKLKQEMVYLMNLDPLQVCSSPLLNSEVEVAWIERQTSELHLQFIQLISLDFKNMF